MWPERLNPRWAAIKRNTETLIQTKTQRSRINGVDLTLLFPAALTAQTVQAIWFASTDSQAPEPAERWLRGKAFSALVFTLKGQFALNGVLQPTEPLLMPDYTEAASITLLPDSQLTGICLQPGVATALFGQRPEAAIPLEELESPLDWAQLENTLLQQPNIWRQALAAYRWLKQHKLDQEYLPEPFATLLQNIANSSGDEKLGQLDSFFNPRKIERQFKHYIGISPKRYQQLSRVNRVMDQLRHEPNAMPLTDIAHHMGYSDQAHLSREFKAFNRITPRQYRTIILNRDSSSTSA